jgi:hypothetical protein
VLSTSTASQAASHKGMAAAASDSRLAAGGASGGPMGGEVDPIGGAVYNPFASIGPTFLDAATSPEVVRGDWMLPLAVLLACMGLIFWLLRKISQ